MQMCIVLSVLQRPFTLHPFFTGIEKRKRKEKTCLSPPPPLLMVEANLQFQTPGRFSIVQSRSVIHTSSIIILPASHFNFRTSRSGPESTTPHYLSFGLASAFKRPRLMMPLPLPPLPLLLGVLTGDCFLDGVAVIVPAILTRFEGDCVVAGSIFS